MTVQLIDGPHKMGRHSNSIVRQVIRYSISYPNMSSARLYLVTLTFSLKVNDSNVRYFRSSNVIISQTITDMLQVAIAIIWETIIYGHCNGIFTFHLGSLQSLRSRSCIFLQGIYLKWWQIEKVLLLPSNRKSCIGFRLHTYIWSWLILRIKVKAVNILKIAIDRKHITIAVK